MGLVEIASSKSVWRAIDYYQSKKVLSWNKTETGYEGSVSGSDNNTYIVNVDIEHPRKSKCTCPFATDHRVICKHMLAVYFSAHPEEVRRIEKEAEEYEKEEEYREQMRKEQLYDYVRMLSKEELRDELVEALYELEYYRRRW